MKKMFFYAAALCLTAVGFASCTAEDEVFPDAVVSIPEDETAVPVEGGAITFNLTTPTNEPFSVQTPDWIEFLEDATMTRGVNSTTTYHFEVAPAVSYQERVGVIRVVAKSGLQDSLVVVQEGVNLSFNLEDYAAPAAGGALAAKLTALPGYTVECPEWIKMNEDPATTHEGVYTDDVTFAIAPITTCKERTGIIRVFAEGVKDSLVVVQSGIGLAIDKTEFTSPTDGATFAVQLTAAAGYKVTCPDWIVMNEDPATTHVDAQTAEVTFTVAMNDTGAERQGEIKIACSDDEHTVTIAVQQEAIVYTTEKGYWAFATADDANNYLPYRAMLAATHSSACGFTTVNMAALYGQEFYGVASTMFEPEVLFNTLSGQLVTYAVTNAAGFKFDFTGMAFPKVWFDAAMMQMYFGETNYAGHFDVYVSKEPIEDAAGLQNAVLIGSSKGTSSAQQYYATAMETSQDDPMMFDIPKDFWGESYIYIVSTADYNGSFGGDPSFGIVVVGYGLEVQVPAEEQ
jgi:hypothetical protein